jgi:threonine dehydratase
VRGELHFKLTSLRGVALLTRVQIWLKREDLQPVFSFKIRGAYNMMAHLSEAEKKNGVITCSAGTSGILFIPSSPKIPLHPLVSQ